MMLKPKLLLQLIIGKLIPGLDQHDPEHHFSGKSIPAGNRSPSDFNLIKYLVDSLPVY
jgi:hypothetical protein